MLLLPLLVACARMPAPVPLDVPVQPLDVAVESADAERGRYLVDQVLVCGECHGADMQGRVYIDGFPMGRIVGPNLTRLDFTTEQWVGAIRHGKSAMGSSILMMPVHQYAKLTQRDLADAIAYLQSLPPDGEILPPLKLGPVGRMLVKKGEWRYHAEDIDHAAPIPTTEGDRGAYLVDAASCLDCHAGGTGKGFGPGQPRSSNITPHADGLGGWTRDQFITAMTTGIRPDGTQLDPFMPWPAYASWTNEDLDEVWTFLQALPPLPTPKD